MATTPTPSGVNDQAVWGGQMYNHEAGRTEFNPNGTPTAVAASSQVGIHASNSDTLFFPSNNVVPSYPYILPEVPSNTAYHRSAYNHAN